MVFYLGACNSQYPSCKSFVPSGVLVKALMLNSGTAQTLYHGGGAKDIPLGKHTAHSARHAMITVYILYKLISSIFYNTLHVCIQVLHRTSCRVMGVSHSATHCPCLRCMRALTCTWMTCATSWPDRPCTTCSRSPPATSLSGTHCTKSSCLC